MKYLEEKFFLLIPKIFFKNHIYMEVDLTVLTISIKYTIIIKENIIERMVYNFGYKKYGSSVYSPTNCKRNA